MIYHLLIGAAVVLIWATAMGWAMNRHWKQVHGESFFRFRRKAGKA